MESNQFSSLESQKKSPFASDFGWQGNQVSWGFKKIDGGNSALVIGF